MTAGIERHRFTPETMQIGPVRENISDIRFTGRYTGKYRLSGTVKLKGTGFYSARITLGNQVVFTRTDGSFIMEVDPGVSGNLIPLFEGYEFSPAFVPIEKVINNRTDITFEINAITAVEPEKQPVSVYPIPTADGKIYLSHVRNESEIVVTDLLGRTVWNGNSGSTDNEIGILLPSKGLYIVTVVNVTGRFSKRVVY